MELELKAHRMQFVDTTLNRDATDSILNPLAKLSTPNVERMDRHDAFDNSEKTLHNEAIEL